ncbi:UDP-glucose pyrophosphorylase, putative [Entamoeba histolytica HM-1:IMSS-B]|uniref:UTP--glucose-1-phosphate uridylyltransferase n=6 Tax=Entamoeba histolytica TaxID=5759 RepID=C4LZ95_ENTH1|nr:UDP-glucose pyrophosphorylase, putative [Entamoeba histolytica HM-1:IMSS]EMD45573.1 UTPglucose-1-phosphate uridylyltransferase, putative [Entamoeba histolytica KU27]EMH75920.1 UDP-glucose pyrophosphorylase, putative [Entamoeba histolytica HM-1:IMSS-B]EMS17707.1 UTP--glucose-1-phosphate uridylyltransferase [Entamoeba histolytica HM-3:IMSS]ENY60162.1 UTP--glucose-1-phosphate uridylyltransferase, putative [Entamoeba histolytica HM-1:IMSS-A]GAT94176.1 UDP-glucose pyrophosphorylase putative [Ent|eukprot:XP_652750.2 UDP-glucose pyrophosphorylase, putative [Entamoeba histolytica HM-1:IMSS]
MNTQEIRTKTEEIIQHLLQQGASEDDTKNLKSFQILHNAYLEQIDKKTTGIEWDKVESLPKEFSVDYSTLDKDFTKEEIIELLKKTCIIKINGGLGTSMGCTGPKSVIEVRNGLTFLDIIILQLKALYREYGVVVPLVLMNSFSTNVETEKVIKKYEQDNDVRILTFLQHKFPRIDAQTLLPVCTELNGRKEEWYPPGHGDFLQSFVDSKAFQTLKEEGKEYLFLSNSDNLGAIPDITIMHHFSKNHLDFALELTPKTLNDVKGGTLIRYGNKLKMLEIAQVPSEHVAEFKDIKKFKVFNTNNIWMNMSAIQHVVEKRTLLNNMDIIVNRKKDGQRDVIQLEIAVGCAVSAFEHTTAYIVPRSRFLPVKACNDLFIIQSTLFGLNESGHMVDNARKVSDIPPSVTFSKDFQFISEYQKHMQHIPNIEHLNSLVVDGNIVFGKNVKLVGDVVLKNTTTKPILLEDKTIENTTLTF